MNTNRKRILKLLEQHFKSILQEVLNGHLALNLGDNKTSFGGNLHSPPGKRSLHAGVVCYLGDADGGERVCISHSKIQLVLRNKEFIHLLHDLVRYNALCTGRKGNINLIIHFFIHLLVCDRWREIGKTGHHNFSEPHMTRSNFCIKKMTQMIDYEKGSRNGLDIFKYKNKWSHVSMWNWDINTFSSMSLFII